MQICAQEKIGGEIILLLEKFLMSFIFRDYCADLFQLFVGKGLILATRMKSIMSWYFILLPEYPNTKTVHKFRNHFITSSFENPPQKQSLSLAEPRLRLCPWCQLWIPVLGFKYITSEFYFVSLYLPP